MPEKKYIEKFQRADEPYLTRRRALPEKLGMPGLWSTIDHFGLYAGVQTLGTRLAVYEIMKRCLDVPGHIVEFGCWKGANLLFMAKVLQLLQPNTYKHVYGFDSFQGLQTFSKADGKQKASAGAYKGEEAHLRTMIDFFEMGDWVHLVAGDALKTIPRFEKENPNIMYSLAYIDFDLYAPCKAALKHVTKRMCPGGIIVFDEALTKFWPGEEKAFFEFLAGQGGAYTAHNVPFARQPTLYLIKK